MGDDKHICAAAKNTKDTCNADEGGALIVDNGHGQYILVGVLNSKAECGSQGATDDQALSEARYWDGTGSLSQGGGLPLTFAKVSKHVNWIDQAMLDNKDEEPEKCHS